jgi:hypothetical protein
MEIKTRSARALVGLSPEYLLALDRSGVSAYPKVCAAYLEDGKDQKNIAKVPPTRVFFVRAGWLWKRAALGTHSARAMDRGHVTSSIS